MNKNKANNNKKHRRKIKLSNQDCAEEWDGKSNDYWVVSDSSCDRLHLQCPGIEYETSDYWGIDLESMLFECESCIDFFSK